MKNSYLEVTFRHGRPFAAYLYLPREAKEDDLAKQALRDHATGKTKPL